MQIVVVITLVLSLSVVGAGVTSPMPESFALTLTTVQRVLLVLATVLASLLASVLFNRRVAARLDRDGSINRRRYRLGLMLLAWSMVLIFAAQIFCLHWQEIPLEVGRLAGVPVIRELAVWAPFLVMLIGFWASAYQVDFRLKLLDMQRRLAMGLPVYSAGGPQGEPRPVWSLGQFLLFQLRFHLLLVLVPLLLIILLYAVLNWWFAGYLDAQLADAGLNEGQRYLVFAGFLLAKVVLVFIVAPALLTAVLSTRVLPAGELRQKLQAVLDRAGARVRRILLWRTHGQVSNAAVMGLWGRLRYVLLSDMLLETLADEQVEGVFGHELGHVIHRHILYYLLFVGAFFFWLNAGFELLGSMDFVNRLRQDELAASLLEGGVLLVVVAAMFLLFGWVSRKFERQADLTGAQAITLAEVPNLHLLPGASGDGPAPSAADNLDLTCPPHPAAAEIYVSALFRIADINGIDRAQRTWRHGSIASRGQHLRRLCDPQRFTRFNGTIAMIKLTIVLSAFGAIAWLLLVTR